METWWTNKKVTLDTVALPMQRIPHRRWPPLLSSQRLSCLSHLCQTPKLFVMDVLLIKWERCWVNCKSSHSNWLLCHLYPNQGFLSSTISLFLKWYAFMPIWMANNNNKKKSMIIPGAAMCSMLPHLVLSFLFWADVSHIKLAPKALCQANYSF